MGKSHDSRYKKLFAHPAMVQELLESFVPLPFVKKLDFSTLEDTKKSFVTKAYKSRESDLIYKVKYQGNDAYIYLLLEFQSTVDYYMPMRMLRYIMEFYDDLTENFRIPPGKLPPVFPLMLYNGEPKWNAPVSIRDIIDCSLFGDLRYIPDFNYFKIAENEFDEAALLEIKNAVAAVFFAENTDFLELADKIKVLKELVKREKPEIHKVFKSWLYHLFDGRDDSELLIQMVDTMWKEEKPMLLASVDRWEQKFFEQGIEQGIEQEKLVTARNLKAMGLDIQLIAQGVGLPVEVIQTL